MLINEDQHRLILIVELKHQKGCQRPVVTSQLRKINPVVEQPKDMLKITYHVSIRTSPGTWVSCLLSVYQFSLLSPYFICSYTCYYCLSYKNDTELFWCYYGRIQKNTFKKSEVRSAQKCRQEESSCREQRNTLKFMYPAFLSQEETSQYPSSFFTLQGRKNTYMSFHCLTCGGCSIEKSWKLLLK